MHAEIDEQDTEEINRQSSTETAHIEDDEEILAGHPLQDEASHQKTAQGEKHFHREPPDFHRRDAVPHFAEIMGGDDEESHQPAQTVQTDDAVFGPLDRSLGHIGVRSHSRVPERKASNPGRGFVDHGPVKFPSG